MRKLFLDIETAPNKGSFWGLFKQNISIEMIDEPGYTLCWSAKWDDEKHVMFMSLNDGKREMLEGIHALLCAADAVVHYNGTNFDIPILNKDFLDSDMLPPDPYRQIDLLLTVRKNFRLTSNKLDFVGNFLGIGGKLPHKGMSLWSGCMSGNAADWNKMERYNKQDVVLLPKLYKKLLPWIKNHPNVALFDDIVDKDGKPVKACTNCGSIHIAKNGMEHLNTQSYQRYKCMDCGTALRGRSTVLLKDKRQVILTQSKL